VLSKKTAFRELTRNEVTKGKEKAEKNKNTKTGKEAGGGKL
jgi:hypothetical protein